ncbi:MAG TPA: LLM class flavin-dependent oxidoreductase [Pararobbsia sp.]|nr:LLM class flavin-dependent oxidoreductase [Pararobbsia sp.]
MTRQIRFNAFEMNCVAHQSPGLWTHPRDRSAQYKDLEYWTDLARILERGLFDGIFIADVLGVYDVYHGSSDHALREAAQVPVNDPLQIIPPMALVTKHLGFGLTTSISFEHPYPFARRMSTLDHLTRGRAGWNIVTSYLNSGARNLGQAAQVQHDDRYEIADEYLEVLYKLWEGSWEDDAVVRDRTRRVFTEPGKVHPIAHQGKHFQVPGIHLSEPSPQRVPVLYQAGASSRGKQFAAANAECIFVAAPSKVVLKKFVADIRRQVAAAGRDPRKVYIYTLLTVVVGETDEAAQRKVDEFNTYASYDGALTFISGWSGVNFGEFTADQRVQYIQTDAVRSMLEAFSTADPDKVWTVNEIARWAGIGGLGPVIVGAPQTVADVLQEWVEDTDVDGFNLAYAVAHETFTDVVELLVPELQRRGAYPTAYTEGTLREKLFGEGPRLAANHPAAQYRRLAHAAPTAQDNAPARPSATHQTA